MLRCIIEDVLMQYKGMDVKNIATLIERMMYTYKAEEYYDHDHLHPKSLETFEYGDVQYYQSWYENGHCKTRCTIKYGSLCGLYESWFENGNKDLECSFDDGKLNGPYTRWYENGELAIQAVYHDSILVHSLTP